MVQGSDMIGDHTVRINRLSLSIKHEMTDLKGDLDKLAEAVGMQRRNSSAGGGSSGDGSRKDGTSVIHSQRMVDSLRMQLGETTKDFQAALQIRATKLREEQDRRHRMGFTDASSTIIQRPLAFGPPGGGSMDGSMGGLQSIGRPAPMNGMRGDDDGSSSMMQHATSSPCVIPSPCCTPSPCYRRRSRRGAAASPSYPRWGCLKTSYPRWRRSTRWRSARRRPRATPPSACVHGRGRRLTLALTLTLAPAQAFSLAPALFLHLPLPLTNP